MRVTLTTPAPLLPAIAASAVFAPMRAPRDREARPRLDAPGELRRQRTLPAGPVAPRRTRARARRNPRFHAASSVRIEAVEYRPVADLNTGLRLFQTGALDTLTNFLRRLDWLRENMPKELHLAPSLGIGCT